MSFADTIGLLRYLAQKDPGPWHGAFEWYYLLVTRPATDNCITLASLTCLACARRPPVPRKKTFRNL